MQVMSAQDPAFTVSCSRRTEDSNMKICTCEHCRYTFRYPLIPLTCPDCGMKKVRPANKKEILRFRIEQQIIADEIRAGLYHECL